MQCPYCGGDSQVVDSRAAAEGIRRRRTCGECRRRFTTYERLSPPNIKVVKRDGKSEGFDSAKLTRTLSRVGRGRPGMGEAEVERMARKLEAQLLDERVKSISSAEIVRRLLGMITDRMTYDRLAANYLDEGGQLRLEQRDGADAGDLPQLELFEGESPESEE